jgi:hypothetical protein
MEIIIKSALNIEDIFNKFVFMFGLGFLMQFP